MRKVIAGAVLALGVVSVGGTAFAGERGSLLKQSDKSMPNRINRVTFIACTAPRGKPEHFGRVGLALIHS